MVVATSEVTVVRGLLYKTPHPDFLWCMQKQEMIEHFEESSNPNTEEQMKHQNKTMLERFTDVPIFRHYPQQACP